MTTPAQAEPTITSFWQLATGEALSVEHVPRMKRPCVLVRSATAYRIIARCEDEAAADELREWLERLHAARPIEEVCP